MPYCVSITKPGSPSVLKIQDIEMPVPKDGEVCIEVHYAGINFADTLMRLDCINQGLHFHSPWIRGKRSNPFHRTGVTGLEVGQRVVAAMPTGGQCSQRFCKGI